jgi:flagellar hook assembly protein FlgD
MKFYTLTGDLVRTETFPLGGPGGMAGLNEYLWDGRNGDGEVVASGGYILVVSAQGQGETLHVMRRKIGVVR